MPVVRSNPFWMQVQVLSRMRAGGKVSAALVALGATAEEVSAARDWADEQGLWTLGHPMSTYSRLLGAPQKVQTHPEDADEYHQLEWGYRFPAWPDYLLSVFGSTDGVAAGLQFVAVEPRRVPLPERRTGAASNDLPSLAYAAGNLPGWSFLEQEILQVLPGPTLIESWYPQSDYECHLPRQAGTLPSRWVAGLDFGLFQYLVPLP